MEAAADDDNHEVDQVELCQMLQAHARQLEQRELSQMRQAAILQRKLDTAEQQLRELQRERQRRQEAASQRASERRHAACSEGARRCEVAARELEAELQDRWAASERRREELEDSLNDARARRQQLEKDLEFWRICGQELLRCVHVEAPMEVDDRAAVEARVAELQTRNLQVQAEIEALQRSCQVLEARVPEVTRLADSSRAQELELRLRNANLEAAITVAESSAATARQRAAVDRQRELTLHEEIRELSADRERVVASQKGCAVATGGGEELAYLKRKLQDRERDFGVLQRERERLQGLLHQYAGLDTQTSDPGSTGTLNSSEDGGGTLGPLSEVASWMAMALFKSALVRRAFCMHLAVLYSWLLFLLWYMSSRSPH